MPERFVEWWVQDLAPFLPRPDPATGKWGWPADCRGRRVLVVWQDEVICYPNDALGSIWFQPAIGRPIQPKTLGQGLMVRGVGALGRGRGPRTGLGGGGDGEGTEAHLKRWPDARC